MNLAFIVTHGWRVGVTSGVITGAVFGGPPGKEPSVLVECQHRHVTPAEAYECALTLYWDIDLPRPTLVTYGDREPEVRP